MLILTQNFLYWLAIKYYSTLKLFFMLTFVMIWKSSLRPFINFFHFQEHQIYTDGGRMGNMLNRYIHWGRRIYQSIIHMHMASESLCYVKNVVSLILAYSYKISPTFKKKNPCDCFTQCHLKTLSKHRHLIRHEDNLKGEHFIIINEI